MKKLTIYSIILVGVSLLFTVAILPGAASAQGRYTSKYSNQDVGNIIATLEQSSGKFKNDFNTAMDKSSLNGTSTEDRFNAIVKDYDNSLNRLRRNYSGNNAWWNNRNDVQDVMNKAQPVNNMMTSLPFARNLERQWNAMRRDINKLADTFDMPGIAGGGWNGGPWNPGNPGNPGGPGWGGTPPSWAQGTFYARNPQTGGTIVMVVNRNGSVNLTFDGGAPAYARMNGTTLTNGPYVSRVSRINNGIRTTSTTNNDFIDYYRNNPGNGGWNPGNPGGPGWGGTPPSWAQGTFYARNPQTGGQIVMIVNKNGSVTLTFDGGAPTYASMNGATLTNGQYVSRVTQLNNGIRTTSTTNNDFIDYYRNVNGGGWNPGGNVPNWAQGTFYARNPQTGGEIVMIVNKNGSVTLTFDGGAPAYASMNGTTLTNGPYVSRVTKINNGIRTTSTTNNDFIDYYRRRQ